MPNNRGGPTARDRVRALLSRPAISRVVTTAVHPFAGVLPSGVTGRIPVVRTFDVRVPGAARSFRLQTDNDDMAMPLFWRGLDVWDPGMVRVLLDLAPSCSTFLDVGANVGIASLLVAAASPSTTVHAFEPVPSIFERLQRNATLNPDLTNLVLHPVGLSDAGGDQTMYVPRHPRMRVPTEASLRADFRENTDSVTVRLKTLDDVVQESEIGRVDLVKIDTEGTTIEVLEGARQTLARDRPFVVCEILNSDHLYEPGQRGEDFIGRILFGLGYRAFHIKDAGPEPCTELRPDPTYRDLDFLFVPEERAVSF